MRGWRLNVLGVRRWSSRPRGAGWSWRPRWKLWHTHRGAVPINDRVRRTARAEGRRYALAVTIQLVSQHVDLPTHLRMTLLELADKVDRFGATRCFSTEARKRRPDDAPLLRISHLLAFIPLSAGSWSLSSSNRSFISFRLLRSASLCETLNSGEREYGVEPESFWGECDVVAPSSGAELDGPGDCSVLVPVDWFARARDVGRERDLRGRDGLDVGLAGMFSGAIAGTDIRRSWGNVPGGNMARFGS